MQVRIGIGYDIHQLKEGRRLILGGVEIPYDKGLLGHSDADVLVHAIADAILGAIGKGDIGEFFPDTDDRFRGISSLVILEDVVAMMHDEGYKVCNIDTIIQVQAPKLSNYKDRMRDNISSVIGISEGCVNIKATTTEGMDAVGRGEAIAAFASVSLVKKE